MMTINHKSSIRIGIINRLVLYFNNDNCSKNHIIKIKKTIKNTLKFVLNILFYHVLYSKCKLKKKNLSLKKLKCCKVLSKSIGK